MSVLCGMMKISRQAVYQQRRAHTDEQLCEEMVIHLVQEQRRRMPHVGSRKLYQILSNDLQKLPVALGRDKFHGILSKNGLLVPKRKRTCSTTNSFHRFHVYGNLLKEEPIVRKNQALVADITYLRVNDTFCYLSLLTDVYSRKILGFDVSDSLSAEGAIRTAKMALRAMSGTKETIHHSDRGIQYCCQDYVGLMEHHGIRLSMGESGNPYDNAIAERINGILKTEFFLDVTFSSVENARRAVEEAIATYNDVRPHMSINYLTPSAKYAT